MEINIEFKGIPLRVVGEYEAGEERTYYVDKSECRQWRAGSRPAYDSKVF